MTTKRDPRVDPRPGDVVRWSGSALEQIVTGIRPDTDDKGQLTTEPPWVRFEWRCRGFGGIGESTLGQWQDDAADFEIVKVAE